MTKPVISLNHVGVTYRSGLPFFKRREVHRALIDVSFQVLRGESLGIIGRNGAGKSTLLRLLNGIIKPDEGDICRDGIRTVLLSLTVGYDPNVSGRDNAIMQGMLLGLAEEEITKQMDEIVEYSELGKFIDQPVKNYSTGMKQRLGFAVATRVESEVLLIDEILSVGDAKFRKKSKKTMHEKLKSGETIVLVSHQTETIRQLCDRAIWIDEGRVMADGDPDSVISEYESAQDK